MNITDQAPTATAQFRALLELPVSDLIQLVNQALETPAIAYWVDGARNIKRGPKDEFGHPNCFEFNLEADGQIYQVNVNTIRDGIQAILSGFADTAHVKGYILKAVADQDLSYIDGEALDMIVQAGVFGIITYS
jgi:hypothetical protein